MPGVPGATTLATRMSFDDPWAAARLLLKLSKEDAADPIVREWSLAILQATAQDIGEESSGPTLSPELRDAFARAIHDNVQSQIKFVHEPKETFQSARTTMALGAGDCDDHARLVYALARAGGLKADLLFLEEDDQPVHVVACLEDSSGMRWAETTLGAMFGEHPLAALDRLGVEGSSDPLSQANASVGLLDFVTAQNVRDRKVQLDASVESIDADVVKCTALNSATVGAWNDFLVSWRIFFADDPSWYNAGGQARQAADFATQIRDWQNRLSASGCTMSAPTLPETASSDDLILGTVKTVAIAAGVVAAAWAAASFFGVLKTARKVA